MGFGSVLCGTYHLFFSFAILPYGDWSLEILWVFNLGVSAFERLALFLFTNRRLHLVIDKEVFNEYNVTDADTDTERKSIWIQNLQ